MKILVVGSGGMLGQQMVRMGGRMEQHIMPRSHAELDITNPDAVKQEIIKTGPDILINCAGIVKGRNIPDDVFMAVNGRAPPKIAEVCDRCDVKMVQVSTDCVFAGDGRHVETDTPNAEDIYGKSKAEGEINHGRHLTIRCSFIGFGERGLLNWLVSQNGTKEVPGFTNVLWNGMTSQSVAHGIILLAMMKDAKGIVHIFGEDTNKFSVLEAANTAFNLGLMIKPTSEPQADYRLRSIFNHVRFISQITQVAPGRAQTILQQLMVREMVNDYRSHTSRTE